MDYESLFESVNVVAKQCGLGFWANQIK